MSRLSRSLLLSAGRALPRIVGAVVGLALVAAEGGVLIAVGTAVFVLSVMTNPARWWHYVRTGNHSEKPVAAAFMEPGTCSVELQSAGGRPIEVIKALREVTEAGLAEAKSKVQAVPAVVAQGLSAESAERVRSQIERAGATVIVVTHID